MTAYWKKNFKLHVFHIWDHRPQWMWPLTAVCLIEADVFFIPFSIPPPPDTENLAKDLQLENKICVFLAW